MSLEDSSGRHSLWPLLIKEPIGPEQAGPPEDTAEGILYDQRGLPLDNRTLVHHSDINRTNDLGCEYGEYVPASMGTR